MTRIFGSLAASATARQQRRAQPIVIATAARRRWSPPLSSTSASAIAPAVSPCSGRLAAWTERRSGLPGWAALPDRLARPRCSSPCSACTGTSPCTSTTGGTPGRSPTRPTTSSSPASSASSPPASSRWCCRRRAEQGRGQDHARLVRAGRRRPDLACGAFALLGFPLDDMWHRIFGQDVTLWGPTHLMLIGGAAMTLVGIPRRRPSR